jgi:hypothetical protein
MDEKIIDARKLAGEKKARKTLIHSALLRGTKAAMKRSSYLA